MVLILASGLNEASLALANRWKASGARVLTPADLSRPGWIYRLPKTDDSVAVVGEAVLQAGDITGVLTLLPHINEADLGHVALEDRAYVAAEMEAFLTAWLDSLECPVINRPTPGCLYGPNWRSGQWVAAAARLGIPVVPVQGNTDHAGSAEAPDSIAKPGTPVVVAGGRCFGAVDSSLADQARRIAEAAGVELLEVRFTGPNHGDAFLSSSLQPDISSEEIAAALLDSFERRFPCQ